MKKNKILICLIICIICIISIIGVSFAWIISQVSSPSIDGYTSGVKFSYELKDTELINEKYNIKNISFFDISDVDAETESTIELAYLPTMAIKVEIEVKNTCDIDMTYTISQVEPNKNNPYILCLFSINDSLPDVGNLSFSNYIENNKEVTGNEIKVGMSSTIYMYVFGVQPDDSATNDFLSKDKTYDFTIQIKGEGK